MLDGMLDGVSSVAAAEPVVVVTLRVTFHTARFS
jgi:hypothetical protein